MFCTGCGHRLGAGRFCTNCGRPITTDAPSDATTERPAVPAPMIPPPSGPPPSAAPPPAHEAPPPPRYPLFYDEVHTAPRGIQQPPVGPPPAATPHARQSGPSWLPWTLTVIVVLLMALIGAMLLLAGGDDGDQQADDATRANGTVREPSTPPSGPQPATPTETPPPADGPQDVARFAAATAPKTAKPNSDTQGNLVRYEPANMLDGVPQTCWRMPGDGTGTELTFTFSGPIELTEVGLINGYAKSAGPLDWYAGNRRVLAVEWVFGDGTVVPQTLSETRDLQSMSIDPVTTSTVVLRLETVSEPGKGPSARNYTPISDVSLVGESV